MGSVYEAEDTTTGQRLAVKVIDRIDEANADTLMSRFWREVQVAMSIEGEHIVKVLDSGQDQATGAPFMVMEYLTGEDLQSLLDRLGPLPSDLALRIAAQACEGIRQAHAAGVVHRDVKPANLFLVRGEEGVITIKVLDFGIAKIKLAAPATLSADLTRTGSMLGSPHYVSPEQARGLKDIDHRTDLWSLGVVLYRALAGVTPYGDIRAIGDLIISICSEAPPSIQEKASWVPPQVAAVVHGALRLSPYERYPNAAAMLDALRSLLPGGSALHETMLVPLTDVERAFVAPKFDMATVDIEPSHRVVRVNAPADQISGYETTLLHDEALPPPRASRPPPPPRGDALPAPVAASSAARRSAWRGPLMLIAVLVILLGAVLVYTALRRARSSGSFSTPLDPGALGVGIHEPERPEPIRREADVAEL
jgi:eukaryotic-like serine/threonine-protein kinase